MIILGVWNLTCHSIDDGWTDGRWTSSRIDAAMIYYVDELLRLALESVAIRDIGDSARG